MILSTKIMVTISNQGKYYASLGYTNIKQVTKILVPLKLLPKNSNVKVTCQCSICNAIFERQYQLINRNEKIFCYGCSRKQVGNIKDHRKANQKNKERSGSLHPRWNPDKEQFVAYAYKVRQLSEKVYEEFYDQINPQNLKRTLCGVDGGYQLDHKIPIKFGFDNNMDPSVLASIDNLQLLPWKENRAKSKELK